MNLIGMANLDSDQDGVFRSLSDSVPSHCSLNIESFSLLTDYHGVTGYESNEFEAGGYKWKLVVYPKGNNKKNVKDHLSVYLRISGANSLQSGWEVSVDYRLFVLDQNKEKYLVIEDVFSKQKCFHGEMLDLGFDKLFPLEEFRDASNGYLVDDKCVFGAEVFVCRERGKRQAERISRIQRPYMYKHAWKLENFSKLKSQLYNSEIFTAEDLHWTILLYPKGDSTANDTHLSLFLQWQPEKTSNVTKVFAEFTLRIVDQNHATNTRSYSSKYCFINNLKGFGWNRFILLGELSRLLKKDTCLVEVEVTVRAIAAKC